MATGLCFIQTPLGSDVFIPANVMWSDLHPVTWSERCVLGQVPQHMQRIVYPVVFHYFRKKIEVGPSFIWLHFFLSDSFLNELNKKERWFFKGRISLISFLGLITFSISLSISIISIFAQSISISPLFFIWNYFPSTRNSRNGVKRWGKNNIKP